MNDYMKFDVLPFSLLTEPQRKRVNEALKIRCYQEGDVLIEPNTDIQSLYIVIKGIVRELHNGETLNVHGPQDVFGAKWLIEGKRPSLFRVEEEALISLLPAGLFEDLVKQNADFSGFFFNSIRDKASLSPGPSNLSANPLLATPVKKVLHEPLWMDENATLRDAAVIMRDQACTSVLLKNEKGQASGLVTSAKLRDSALIDGLPADTPVADVCLTNMIGVEASDTMSEAMITMVKHKINRIVVREEGQVIGILELTDMLSFLSNHSYLLFLQVERARNVEDLQTVVDRLNEMVGFLQGNGSSVPIITRLVSEVNQRLFAKLFAFLSPDTAFMENTCLLVMGSEGRREQIIRTDQDNALIVRDGFDLETARSFAQTFSKALEGYGFPPCPGSMMVSNPDWCLTLSDLKTKLFDWVSHPSEEKMIALSAFIDAISACGDEQLLIEAKQYLYDILGDNDTFYGVFASPIDAFDTPLGLFHRLKVERGAHEGEMDLKKGGIFTIVHGARVLAVKHRVHATNTVRRIRALCENGVLDQAFADDLIDAFDFLRALKLKASFSSDGTFKGATNFVRIRSLHKLEKDLLKDSLQLVKEFKGIVIHHFHLERF